MSIQLDHASFRELVDVTVGGSPDPSEMRAVIAVAQLAASIDLETYPEEQLLLGMLLQRLCDISGLDIDRISPVSPIPLDDEDRAAALATLAPELVTRGARELAYVLAYLLIVVDVELKPVETRFLADLQHVLEIPDARANDLIDLAAQLVTPEPQPRPEQRLDY